MDHHSIWLQVCNLKRPQRERVLRNAIWEYAGLMSEIYNDIYESCIKVFYSTYTPVKYKRHGDLAGFNLYSAFASEVTNTRLDATYLPNELLSYRRVSREDVLDAVVNGQRGTTVRLNKKSGDWPQSWAVTYPNGYSHYSIWKSGCTTIEDILSDFDENGPEQTVGIFWGIVKKYL